MENKTTRTRKPVKIHKYEVVIDLGYDQIVKKYIPALSEKELREKWERQGDIIRIKEVPEYLPDAARVRDDLMKMGYGAAELDFIYRILSEYVEGTC